MGEGLGQRPGSGLRARLALNQVTSAPSKLMHPQAAEASGLCIQPSERFGLCVCVRGLGVCAAHARPHCSPLLQVPAPGACLLPGGGLHPTGAPTGLWPWKVLAACSGRWEQILFTWSRRSGVLCAWGGWKGVSGTRLLSGLASGAAAGELGSRELGVASACPVPRYITGLWLAGQT